MNTRIRNQFRELTKRASFGRDARHSLHAYPAKLLPNIPYYFLHSGILKNSGIVLDPFCGTGTVLLEASLAGHTTVGAEINPLATLITEVKMSKLGPIGLENAHRRVNGWIPSTTNNQFRSSRILNIGFIHMFKAIFSDY